MREAKFLLLCAGIFVVSAVVGCGDAPAPVVPQPSAQKAAPKVAATAQVAEEKALEPPKYIYETANRRDPFEPLVLDVPTDKPAGGAETTPLQQYSIDQFRVVGVIVGKGHPAAMVIAPDGKGYVLRKGIKIGKNNGVVVAISASSVIVEEQNLDFSGTLLKNQVELKLTKREGAK